MKKFGKLSFSWLFIGAGVACIALISCVSLKKSTVNSQNASFENRSVMLSCKGESHAQFQITQLGRETVLSGNFAIENENYDLNSYVNRVVSDENSEFSESKKFEEISGFVKQTTNSKAEKVEKNQLKLSRFSWNPARDSRSLTLEFGKKMVQFSGCQENPIVVAMVR